MRPRDPPVHHLLCSGYKRGLYAFKSQPRHHERGWEGVTIGKQVLATSAWAMRYANDAGVVSHSPEKVRKMMGGIVVVCAVFGCTVSEIKTEIMCLHTKGRPESAAKFSVEAAGGVYSQTNKFVYLGGNVDHNTNLPIEVNRGIRSAWCSFGKYTLKLYDRQSAPLELRLPDAKSQGTQDNAVRLRHEKLTSAPLRHAAPRPPQLPDSLHRLVEEKSHRPLDFLSEHT